MNSRLLLAYQLFTGISDSCTGLLLIFAPALTLRWMGVHGTAETYPFVSFIGAFVLSVGLACFYGARLAVRTGGANELKVVSLLTAITRALVAVVVSAQIISGNMECRWCTVAIFDGVIALFQVIGLRRGWLVDATH